jgi:hypothetical protein
MQMANLYCQLFWASYTLSLFGQSPISEGCGTVLDDSAQAEYEFGSCPWRTNLYIQMAFRMEGSGELWLNS